MAHSQGLVSGPPQHWLPSFLKSYSISFSLNSKFPNALTKAACLFRSSASLWIDLGRRMLCVDSSFIVMRSADLIECMDWLVLFYLDIWRALGGTVGARCVRGVIYLMRSFASAAAVARLCTAFKRTISYCWY